MEQKFLVKIDSNYFPEGGYSEYFVKRLLNTGLYMLKLVKDEFQVKEVTNEKNNLACDST